MSLSFPDQVTLDKTPNYWAHNDTPSRVYEMNKDIKLILLLRDPVQRCLSDFMHNVQFGHIQPNITFEEYILDESGLVKKDLRIIYSSLYNIHMKRWLRFFPKSQFFTASQEDYHNSYFNFFSDVQSYLGLKRETWMLKYMYKNNCWHDPIVMKYGKLVCLYKKKHPAVNPDAEK
jgi:hypothetical protein